MKVNKQHWKIFGLYFFLLAGGLWHLLGVLQSTMAILAGPLLIGLAVWLAYEFLSAPKTGSGKKQLSNPKFLSWAALVVIVSFIVEAVGVKTGKIFGVYAYGETLWPQLAGVPLAIGFAWLLMMLSSTALMQKLPVINQSHVLIRTVIVALLMTFFDFMMEPAAIKLGYWTWQNPQVPLQNYLAWFILSGILAGVGGLLGLFNRSQPAIAFHAYFAQMIYFIMILFK